MSNLNARPGNIKEITVHPSAGGSSIDISPLVTEFKYYENIQSPTLTISLVVVEAGDTRKINATGNNPTDILDGLPIRGGEKVDIVFEDNQATSTKYTFKGEKNCFYINRVKVLEADTQKKVYILELCSKEYLRNEQARVIPRFEGLISDSVERILKDQTDFGLKTQKNKIIDKTLNKYNFLGNTKKPFYTLTWLAKKSVPEGAGKLGGAAGYFFYETYNGFNFRSIDKLFQQKIKKKFVFTNSTELGPAYAEYNKILSAPSIERNIDLHQNLSAGVYANRTIFYNLFNMNYEQVDYTLSQQKDKVEIAGGDYEFVAKEFRDKQSRYMTSILDIGAVPKGVDAKEQLKNWKSEADQPNFKAREIMVQSIMRYNQLFTIKLDIMIAGDMSLNAGDLIVCEFPDIANTPNKSKNGQTTGIYMIASLCHRLTSKDTYTSLTLVRDSFGKKK